MSLSDFADARRELLARAQAAYDRGDLAESDRLDDEMRALRLRFWAGDGPPA